MIRYKNFTENFDICFFLFLTMGLGEAEQCGFETLILSD
jgi:hypothetical protein